MLERSHSFILENRAKLNLSGVSEVGSFSENEIVVYTVLGELRIKGTELQILNVSVESEGQRKGSMEVIGKIDSAVYSDNTRRVPNNFITKIFK